MGACLEITSISHLPCFPLLSPFLLSLSFISPSVLSFPSSLFPYLSSTLFSILFSSLQSSDLLFFFSKLSSSLLHLSSFSSHLTSPLLYFLLHFPLLLSSPSLIFYSSSTTKRNCLLQTTKLHLPLSPLLHTRGQTKEVPSILPLPLSEPAPVTHPCKRTGAESSPPH